ncbi:hypothetical protein [Nonomuraea turcica]|nr:hypothetical protein [Nonomuraea sp. G32]MDP4511377.1 hypothetical protein [Nonomuraea sp. G32]
MTVAGQAWVDRLFMAGLLGIGLALANAGTTLGLGKPPIVQNNAWLK